MQCILMLGHKNGQVSHICLTFLLSLDPVTQCDIRKSDLVMCNWVFQKHPVAVSSALSKAGEGEINPHKPPAPPQI